MTLHSAVLAVVATLLLLGATVNAGGKGSKGCKVSGSKWPSAILLFWHTKIANLQICRLEQIHFSG